MGISMSESDEIRRLEASDVRYHAKYKERVGHSAPQQFRDIENQ